MRERDRELKLAENLMKSYVHLRTALKDLGVVRTFRSLESDYAEWLCAKLFSLKLNDNPNEAGYDAIDERGNRYQIKGRRVRKLGDNTSFDFKSWNFDYMLCVFFSQELDLIGIAKVPVSIVREYTRASKSNFRFRWRRDTYEDKRIEWIFQGIKVQRQDRRRRRLEK